MVNLHVIMVVQRALDGQSTPPATLVPVGWVGGVDLWTERSNHSRRTVQIVRLIDGCICQIRLTSRSLDLRSSFFCMVFTASQLPARGQRLHSDTIHPLRALGVVNLHVIMVELNGACIT